MSSSPWIGRCLQPSSLWRMECRHGSRGLPWRPWTLAEPSISW